jgi:CDP-diacylglycerol--glycerol-3-phosphate 3-phosphatidyltransferase
MDLETRRKHLHDRLERLIRPLAALLARANVSPNQVSVAGAGLNVVAAALVMQDALVPAGILYLLAGSLDLMDGALARLAHRSTPFGAFLDSTLDRLSEGIVFAAVVYHFAQHGRPLEAGLVVLALLGSLLVSYTRARAEALGAECKVGVMTRAERVVLVALGLLFAWLPLAMLILVALTGFTVVQRILQASRTLRSGGLTAPPAGVE